MRCSSSSASVHVHGVLTSLGKKISWCVKFDEASLNAAACGVISRVPCVGVLSR
jgi:hypothetical protein